MLADPFVNFTKAIGAEVDKSERGLGIRSNRYAMLINNLKVLNIKEEAETAICEALSAENFLKLV
jgi:peroxiredoxin (alkyl hydroperoxide reductase subunit C)